MRRGFFIIGGILAAAWIGVLVAGCGGSNNSTNSSNGSAGVTALATPLGMTLEDMSAANLTDVFGEGMDATATEASSGPFLPAGSGEVGGAVLFPQAPPWWFYLYPLRQRVREEARAVIEAPAELASYIITHPGSMPACVNVSASPTCPLNPDLDGDTCTTTITFTDPCPVTFLAGSTVIVLDLSGSLTRSAQVTTPSSGATVWDGVWQSALTASTFNVTDPISSRAMTYDGLLTRVSDGTTAADPYKWKNTWTSDAFDNPMTLTNSAGDQLIADGTRQDWVLPGNSAEQFINTTPTIIPAVGSPRHIQRIVHRAVTLSGDTATVSVDAAITQLDFNQTWFRQGDHTLYRQNPTKVVINGTSVITTPKGRTETVDLVDVVRDLNHQVPISGDAVVTLDNGLVYTVTFTGVCSLSWQDTIGHSGHVNYCQWNSFAD